MKNNPVIKQTSFLLIPVILLFGLYVQFHGDYSPGGGFQAGVIFASGLILYALIEGQAKAEQVFSMRLARILSASGLLLYAGIGVASMFLGANFLDYNVLADDPLQGQHWGIFWVELGVGLTVTSVMLSIFYAFTNFK
ncbi:MAG: Na(+)/H(+) antiporter subunit B [Gammaproteobacteria bacterium]|nr:Na(+)/H(+) antiporter subunit B [Gammaproteobacteria bacterium]